MICLLSLGIILSGCVQREQPKEPPVEDNDNEKLPEVNNEESNLGDEILENEEGSDKDDEQEEDYIIDSEIYQFITVQEYLFELSPSQFEILDESTIKKLKIQVPLIKVENEETNNFNNQMIELYNYALKEYTYEDEDLSTALTVNFECYLESEILSIVIYSGGFMWESASPSTTISVYNYSLIDNKFLTNEEMIKILGYDVNLIEQKLSDILTENYKKNTPTDVYGERISEYNPKYEDKIYYEITDESKLYLNNGLHFVLKGYIGITKKNYDIKVIMEE